MNFLCSMYFYWHTFIWPMDHFGQVSVMSNLTTSRAYTWSVYIFHKILINKTIEQEKNEKEKKTFCKCLAELVISSQFSPTS